MKDTLLVGGSNIGGRIETFKKTMQGIDTESHLLACSTLQHIIKNNEYSLAEKLVDAMGRSQRKNALIRWFTAMAPCTWDTTALKFKYDAKRVPTSLGLEGTKGGMAVPFWDYSKEEEVVKNFDLKKLLAGLVHRCEERVAEASGSDLVHKKTKINMNTLKALRKMVGEVE